MSTLTRQQQDTMETQQTHKIPLHLQAEEYLRKLIQEKEYKDGKLLPREIELSKQLKISRNTLRQAISRLVMEGLLIRKKGIGTKVAPKSIVSGLKNWLSFSQEMKQMGLEICNFELHLSYKYLSDDLCYFFQIPEEKRKLRALVLERVRGTEDNPFVYFISYFNPMISLNSNDDFTRPLYDLLEKEHNIIVKSSREEISARLADEIIAEKLDTEIGVPILVRKRFISDVNQKPIEYNIGYYKAECFTYTIQADRQ